MDVGWLLAVEKWLVAVESMESSSSTCSAAAAGRLDPWAPSMEQS